MVNAASVETAGRFSTHENGNATSVAIQLPPHTAWEVCRNLKTHGAKCAVLPQLCFYCHVLCGGRTN